MTSRYSTALRSIAALLVISMAQFCVLANPGRALFGRLVTNSNSVVSVNGNDALSGMTIYSGAHLQTPPDVTASVDLGRMGRVEVSSGTTLTLSFSEGSVAVEVSTGHALLFTGEGVNGSIKNPEDELFGNDVEQSAQDEAAFKACKRTADLAFKDAVKEAKGNLKQAERKAEEAYRTALKAAKTEAERKAAKQAKQKALKQARDESRKAIKSAERARDQAIKDCQTKQNSKGAHSSKPSPKIVIPGLAIIGVILAVIYIPCRRGRNPSPGTPRGSNDC